MEVLLKNFHLPGSTSYNVRHRAPSGSRMAWTSTKSYLPTKNGSLWMYLMDISHTSTKEALLEWPSRSPNLNIIENTWKMLEDIIYKENQFDNKRQLMDAINLAAEKIQVEMKDKIQNLFKGIHRRLHQCILKKGEATEY